MRWPWPNEHAVVFIGDGPNRADARHARTACCDPPSAVRDRTLPTWYFRNPLRRWLVDPGRLLDTCGPNPGDAVADLGAGGGFFLPELLERVGPMGRVYAVDIDEAAISEARAIGQSLRTTDRIEFVPATAAFVPSIPMSGIDFVLSNGLLCCLLEKERAVEEMWRVLKPGGRALVTFTTIGPRWTRRGRALRTSDSRFHELLSRRPWEVVLRKPRPLHRRYVLRKPSELPYGAAPVEAAGGPGQSARPPPPPKAHPTTRIGNQPFELTATVISPPENRL